MLLNLWKRTRHSPSGVRGMKPISYYLPWPMTGDIEAVLTNLPWDKKLELSVALAQRALDEKTSLEARQRQRPESQQAP
jgi:hypothetical protein